MPQPNPPLLVEAFAINADVGTITTPIPVTTATPGVASLDKGFPALTMTPEVSGGQPFLGPDLQGILYMATANIVALTAGQFAPFNATLAAAMGGYAVGAIVASADGSGAWINLSAANSVNPDTTGTGWAPLYSYGVTVVSGLTNANVVLDPVDASKSILVFSGTLTGNVQITLPANVQQWLVVNNCTGAFTLSIIAAGGTGIVIAQGGSTAPTGIYCDGTNINPSFLSAASFAPINSPAFTGVPTAPTAAPGTNTTQLATMAALLARVPFKAAAAFISSAGVIRAGSFNVNGATHPGTGSYIIDVTAAGFTQLPVCTVSLDVIGSNADTPTAVATSPTSVSVQIAFAGHAFVDRNFNLICVGV